jgi:hypothetical protein
MAAGKQEESVPALPWGHSESDPADEPAAPQQQSLQLAEVGLSVDSKIEVKWGVDVDNEQGEEEQADKPVEHFRVRTALGCPQHAAQHAQKPDLLRNTVVGGYSAGVQLRHFTERTERH